MNSFTDHKFPNSCSTICSCFASLQRRAGSVRSILFFLFFTFYFIMFIRIGDPRRGCICLRLDRKLASSPEASGFLSARITASHANIFPAFLRQINRLASAATHDGASGIRPDVRSDTSEQNSRYLPVTPSSYNNGVGAELSRHRAEQPPHEGFAHSRCIQNRSCKRGK